MKLITLQQVQTNIGILAQYVRGQSGSILSDRATYFDCLNQIQKYKLLYHKERQAPYLDFDLSNPHTHSVLESLLRSREFEDEGSVDPVMRDDQDAIIDRLGSAQRLLRNYCPLAADLVKILIAWLIFVRKDGYAGGSFWHILGAVWMSPTKAWEIRDYAENLLHETVHQAMFLDDMVHGLFSASPEDLAADTALVTSSIRGAKRPYDYSFHAATVSVALIDFYEYLGMPDRAVQFCRPLLQTLAELETKRHLLSAHGIETLSRMIALVSDSPTFNEVSGNAIIPVSV